MPETSYNLDGRPTEDNEGLGFTVKVTDQFLLAELDQFYSKFGECTITATRDVTEAQFVAAVAAFCKALP